MPQGGSTVRFGKFLSVCETHWLISSCFLFIATAKNAHIARHPQIHYQAHEASPMFLCRTQFASALRVVFDKELNDTKIGDKKENKDLDQLEILWRRRKKDEKFRASDSSFCLWPSDHSFCGRM